MIVNLAGFPRNYWINAVLLPSFYTAGIVFSVGFLAFRGTATGQGRSVEILAGSVLIFVCAGSFEFLSRKLTGRLQSRLNTEGFSDSATAITALKSVFQNPGDELVRIKVLKYGRSPLVYWSWQLPDQIWMNEKAVSGFDGSALSHLIAHQLIVRRHSPMIDRVLMSAGFWWASVVAVMLLAPNPAIIVLAALASAVLWIWICRVGRLRQTGLADKTATQLFGSADYFNSIAGMMHRCGTASREIKQRLMAAGLDLKESKLIIDGLDG